jgi:FkbM family methyltransferase
MIIHEGIYLPDGDVHFPGRDYPLADYQVALRIAAYEFVSNWTRCVDLGAHVGLFSRDFATRFEEVVAFEPNPKNRECLRLNTPANVIIQPYAVGRGTGSNRLFHVRLNSGGSLIVDDPTMEFREISHLEGEYFDVDVRALDEYGYDGVGLIKLDIQGAEVNALIGAKETILRNRPVVIIEEKPIGGPDGGREHIIAATALLLSYGLEPRTKVRGDRVYAFPA